MCPKVFCGMVALSILILMQLTCKSAIAKMNYGFLYNSVLVLRYFEYYWFATDFTWWNSFLINIGSCDWVAHTTKVFCSLRNQTVVSHEDLSLILRCEVVIWYQKAFKTCVKKSACVAKNYVVFINYSSQRSHWPRSEDRDDAWNHARTFITQLTLSCPVGHIYHEISKIALKKKYIWS